jgi:hypothetical protein
MGIESIQFYREGLEKAEKLNLGPQRAQRAPIQFQSYKASKSIQFPIIRPLIGRN